MTRVLLTAFGPIDRWSENSSWLALTDLTSWYDDTAEIVTRRYPVDLTRMSQEQLQDQLRDNYDLAIHLGQSPGSPLIKLERVGLNVCSDGSPLIAGCRPRISRHFRWKNAAVELIDSQLGVRFAPRRHLPV